ncbi:MerR family transcriptional regulator [Bosea sp. 2KB_26]|uniref:MerR family transcriptional regulator n=1 Tax=Bosea sp. 2KB_26 TaxID=3237475 RepID=UPI003F90D5D2
MNTYSISQMALDFSVTLRTLRFYEQRGLLSPQRAGLARVYSQADRERVREILVMRKLGFTVTEIKTGCFPREKLMDQLALLRDQRAQLDESISELETRVAA